MADINAISTKIKEHKVLPLFYHDDADTCIEVLNILYEYGMYNVEFTNRGAHALANYKKLKAHAVNHLPMLSLGIGTLHNSDDAIKYINEGADFLVSPFFDKSIASVSKEKKCLWIPGCMTPTEVHNAQAEGFSMLKLFPGNVLGPGYVEAIKPLFQNIDYIVTGGVSVDRKSFSSWFDAGISVLGLGSKLISKEILQNKDFKLLRTLSAEVRSLIETK